MEVMDWKGLAVKFSKSVEECKFLLVFLGKILIQLLKTVKKIQKFWTKIKLIKNILAVSRKTFQNCLKNGTFCSNFPHSLVLHNLQSPKIKPFPIGLRIHENVSIGYDLLRNIYIRAHIYLASIRRKDASQFWLKHTL